MWSRAAERQKTMTLVTIDKHENITGRPHCTTWEGRKLRGREIQESNKCMRSIAASVTISGAKSIRRVARSPSLDVEKSRLNVLS